MDLAKIKLVAADLDGTLLNSRHELSPDFFPVFDKMKTKGVLFAAASGRQFYNILNKFAAIQEDVIFVAENGSYVVYKDEELLVQAMETDIVKEQLITTRKIPGIYTILCGKKKAYVESDAPQFMENLRMYYDRFEVVNDLLEVADDQFLKIAICDLAGAERNSYLVFKQQQEHLQVKVSGNIWLDLSHKLANKGRAINVLQNKFGISVNETMVFGDYLNDLEMMQQAGFSYAMENAHIDIKNAARFTTKSNDQDGVKIILEQMLSAMEK